MICLIILTQVMYLYLVGTLYSGLVKLHQQQKTRLKQDLQQTYANVMNQ